MMTYMKGYKTNVGDIVTLTPQNTNQKNIFQNLIFYSRNFKISKFRHPIHMLPLKLRGVAQICIYGNT
jgi:hypothetical protein